MIRAARSLVQKLTEEEKKQAISTFIDSFRALHSTLNMNVDDLDDVVGGGGGKLEAPKEDVDELLPETDPAELVNKVSKKEENEKCADCGEGNPMWVSVFGCCFVCSACGEAHKEVFRNRLPDGQVVKK